MIKKLLMFLVLSFLMAGALITYSTSHDAVGTFVQGQSAIAKYVQLAKTKTLAVTKPVLKKFGVDIDNTHVEDMNIVERQMENAAEKVTEANQQLGK